MSEVASRPAASRGRGSGRGGRGGFGGRGAPRKTNGDKLDRQSAEVTVDALEDEEGEFAELRKKYGDKTSAIREMFPDWSDADVLFALQETNGDPNEAVARIAEGNVSQWGEVSKPKKAARAKAVKDSSQHPATSETPLSTSSRNARGGRSASDAARGRARGSDRGGRGGRGRNVNAAPNASRNKENQPLSVPTQESSAWDNPVTTVDNAQNKPAAAVTPATRDAPQPAPTQPKTWASMLRQSTAPKPAPAPLEPSVPKSADADQTKSNVVEPVPLEDEASDPLEETTPIAQTALPAALPAVAELESILSSARAQLTETNLERVADTSAPPPTETAASTAADSWDPRQSPVSASGTPLSAAQQQHQAQRTATSGFAASAMKATADRSSRLPNPQRRVLDQEEAVRMPGNREVDRTAVQFGAFNLQGSDEDIDGEREEPETRAQPPADSPVTHPRASLPPVSQPVAVPDSFAQKPVVAAPSAGAPGIGATAPPAHQQAPTAPQYGRFAQSGPQDIAAPSQKPADPFSHQASAAAQQSQFDNFASQTSQPQSQQHGGAYGSVSSDYHNYYSASQPERNPYNNYYGQQYGSQQAAHGQHEAGVPSQQRPFGGYNMQSDNLTQYPQSGAMHAQPRFAGSSENQNSGHSTPNPGTQAQQQLQGQQLQGHQPSGAPGTQPQSHAQQYPGYNHPYYNNPYYHQYYSGYGQGGFGPYGGKAGMYGQPYGVSPNAPYEQHASSPGTFGPASLHRDSGLSSSLGDYGRATSAQAGNQPGLAGSSFGAGAASHDNFGRGASSFPSQPTAAGSSDELKAYGEAKAAGSGPGPSPSLGGGPRPGSAANNAGAQAGLPPPQSSQMGSGYGGYPHHLQGHGSGYGMGAGGAAASQHGSTPYGSYGQDFGGVGAGGAGAYYGVGGQQQQQQQRGGWGGNYH